MFRGNLVKYPSRSTAYYISKFVLWQAWDGYLSPVFKSTLEFLEGGNATRVR
jgi:hypothetical protein